ncbi:MAG TPA: HipA domain-containing protein [Phenylobacterium sp.]|jgi:serine/threonine-protein kinase HipA|nr:HipA domain-containing protein [Phenylobacterium sp.]
MADSLEIRLAERRVGELTGLGNDRTIFVFDDAYVEDPARPTLSLSFKSATGELLRDQKPTRIQLLPFFSNLLPEGQLRDYLAERAGVKAVREFHLLAALGDDLPGAVTAHTPDGSELSNGGTAPAPRFRIPTTDHAMRFSLAGVQLKFSAVTNADGGLTIPVHGDGGDWIVKLPSNRYEQVSENEFSMMTMARTIGIEVPEIKLVALDEIAGLPEGIGRLAGQAFATARFDRPFKQERLHMEDFAQVFGVYPDEKYGRASYRNIAEVIWREVGGPGLVEFIRRLVFNALIGNADMHLKNWSLLYRDGINATVAPAYDFVATTAYIPDEKASLKVVRSKFWRDFNQDELAYMAAKAGLPEHLVLKTATDTVAAFREVWGKEKANLPLPGYVAKAIDHQLEIVPLARH